MGILRLAHVDVRTPDLELSTAYYTEVLGLQLAGRGKEGEDTVYLKCWDEEDHHSVRLRYDPRTGPSESRVASRCRLRTPTAATVRGPGASSGIPPRTAAGNVMACAT